MRGKVMRRTLLWVLALLALVATALYSTALLPKNKWSIGIYAGGSPLSLGQPEGISNPVLSAGDVGDIDAMFIADPFMVRRGATWYMFFEAMNSRTGQGDIGLATSGDGLGWTYNRIVLDEPFHLSYPYVFEWKGDYYMIPETKENRSVRLYRAVDFPYNWTYAGTLLRGEYQDSTVFRFNGTWWMFTSDRNDRLYLYYSDALDGAWTAHPRNPIVGNNADIARPGGRVVEFNGSLIRFCQDDFPIYGNSIRAFAITRLTRGEYEEIRVQDEPALAGGGEDWRRWGMHTLDAHELADGSWIAAVDGK